LRYFRALIDVSEMSDTGVYDAAPWKEPSATGRLPDILQLLHPDYAIQFKLRVARSLLKADKTQNQ